VKILGQGIGHVEGDFHRYVPVIAVLGFMAIALSIRLMSSRILDRIPIGYPIATARKISLN
jgi:hypothetical protein